MYKRSFILYILCWFALNLQAQYPSYFIYDSENGLPSNEVYSIIQDPKGFIWIGCDAGLYRFNGIKYQSYKSKIQKSKTISGLNLSSSGKLYGYNFHGQLFCIENDSLTEIPHSFKNINGINANKNGNIYVNHSDGIGRYNEKTKQWTQYDHFKPGTSSFTRSARTNLNNETYFLTEAGIGKISNEKCSIISTSIFDNSPPGTFMLECINNEVWIFSRDQNHIYKVQDEITTPVTDKDLVNILSNRKITHIKAINDHELWICTYQGLIIYNVSTGKSDLLYPQYAISDIIADREGNYWMSTLQSGILRIPDMNYTVWNSSHSAIPNNMITRVSGYNDHIYFSTVNGSVGLLETSNNKVTGYNIGSSADVQCLEYMEEDQQVFFFINHDLYTIKNNSVQLKKKDIPPVKTIVKTDNEYVTGSSFGCFTYDKTGFNVIDTLANSWTREILVDKENNLLYLATNNGLIVYKKAGTSWKLHTTFLNDIQVLSMDIAPYTQQVFVLSFDGKVNSIQHSTNPVFVTSVPEDIQCYTLKHHANKLYITTNKGLRIFDLSSKTWLILDNLSGLASNSVQDIYIDKEFIWLATGNGLQKLPLVTRKKIVPSIIYIRDLKIGEKTADYTKSLQLNYNDHITITPEVSNYRSNGNYQYAYRVNSMDTNWTYLPSNITSIHLSNIPTGPFNIEIRSVDHQGIVSGNTIRIPGYVKPPFWQTKWFYISISLFILFILYLIYRIQIRRFKNKQAKLIEKIQLENELQLAQQTALKAQMNPHFIFNVLNSIKGYIYKNDKTNASQYLGDFSDLIRIILEMSSKQYVVLEEEIRMIELYIGLESMLLQKELDYTMNIDEKIDIHGFKIPSLILQPFVENAFKHGLRHSEHSKKLELIFQSITEDKIHIIIRDNGIGRTASEIINKKNHPSHQSFATGAIQKRVDLINKEKKQTIHFNINDLVNKEQKPMGTEVIITIQDHE